MLSFSVRIKDMVLWSAGVMLVVPLVSKYLPWWYIFLVVMLSLCTVTITYLDANVWQWLARKKKPHLERSHFFIPQKETGAVIWHGDIASTWLEIESPVLRPHVVDVDGTVDLPRIDVSHISRSLSQYGIKLHAIRIHTHGDRGKSDSTGYAGTYHQMVGNIPYFTSAKTYMEIKLSLTTSLRECARRTGEGECLPDGIKRAVLITRDRIIRQLESYSFTVYPVSLSQLTSIHESLVQIIDTNKYDKIISYSLTRKALPDQLNWCKPQANLWLSMIELTESQGHRGQVTMTHNLSVAASQHQHDRLKNFGYILEKGRQASILSTHLPLAAQPVHALSVTKAIINKDKVWNPTVGGLGVYIGELATVKDSLETVNFTNKRLFISIASSCKGALLQINAPIAYAQIIALRTIATGNAHTVEVRCNSKEWTAFKNKNPRNVVAEGGDIIIVDTHIDPLPGKITIVLTQKPYSIYPHIEWSGKTGLGTYTVKDTSYTFKYKPFSGEQDHLALPK